MDSKRIKTAVLAYYRYKRNFVYIATELFDEDVVVSDGVVVYTVEVKTTFGDYRREFKKEKYKLDEDRGGRILPPNEKYFAAPLSLAERIAKDSDSNFGVIAVNENGDVNIIKKARVIHKSNVKARSLKSTINRMGSELVMLRTKDRHNDFATSGTP